MHRCTDEELMSNSTTVDCFTTNSTYAWSPVYCGALIHRVVATGIFVRWSIIGLAMLMIGCVYGLASYVYCCRSNLQLEGERDDSGLI